MNLKVRSSIIHVWRPTISGNPPHTEPESSEMATTLLAATEIGSEHARQIQLITQVQSFNSVCSLIGLSWLVLHALVRIASLRSLQPQQGCWQPRYTGGQVNQRFSCLSGEAQSNPKCAAFENGT